MTGPGTDLSTLQVTVTSVPRALSLRLTQVKHDCSRAKSRRSREKIKTALHRANVVLDGHAGSEKSPAINGIAAKIENAQRRLESLIEARNRAVEQIENLPGDIERLEAALAQAEAGGEIEMPEGLTMIEASNEAEVEVEAGMGESES